MKYFVVFVVFLCSSLYICAQHSTKYDVYVSVYYSGDIKYINLQLVSGGVGRENYITVYNSLDRSKQGRVRMIMQEGVDNVGVLYPQRDKSYFGFINEEQYLIAITNKKATKVYFYISLTYDYELQDWFITLPPYSLQYSVEPAINAVSSNR